MHLQIPKWYRSVLRSKATEPYPTDPHDMTRQIPNDPGRAGRSVSRPSSQSLPVAALTLVFSIWAGITCFATVGMFSAVTNLGAGGTQDTALSDISNGVLYGMFSLTGLVSGGINNRAFSSLIRDYRGRTHDHASFPTVLGPRLTLCLGSLGYSLYIGSLWW